jgi:hypothetical protein
MLSKNWTVDWSISIHDPIVTSNSNNNIKKHFNNQKFQNENILKCLHSNYCAYPIITRWKLENRHNYMLDKRLKFRNETSQKNVLQFMCVERNGVCYIPGVSDIYIYIYIDI